MLSSGGEGDRSTVSLEWVMWQYSDITLILPSRSSDMLAEPHTVYIAFLGGQSLLFWARRRL